MKQEEQIRFEDIVAAMSSRYPHRQIELKHEYDNRYLYVDGECKFCTTGYCLLYNMQRLCKALESELL